MGYLWRHCDNGHELTQPKTVDHLLGHVTCPECGDKIYIDDDERRYVLQELVDRLERLTEEAREQT